MSGRSPDVLPRLSSLGTQRLKSLAEVQSAPAGRAGGCGG